MKFQFLSESLQWQIEVTKRRRQGVPDSRTRTVKTPRANCHSLSSGDEHGPLTSRSKMCATYLTLSSLGSHSFFPRISLFLPSDLTLSSLVSHSSSLVSHSFFPRISHILPTNLYFSSNFYSSFLWILLFLQISFILHLNLNHQSFFSSNLNFTYYSF